MRRSALTLTQNKTAPEREIFRVNDLVGDSAAEASKLDKALTAKKVARYQQIENKIRALIKYDLAATVSLVQ